MVVLPGILGSTLRQDGNLIWAPSAGPVLHAIGTLGGSVERLRTASRESATSSLTTGWSRCNLMPDLHILPGIWTAVKGYDRLLDRLRSLGYREPGPGEWPGREPAPGALRLAAVMPVQRKTARQHRGTGPAAVAGPGGTYAEAQVVFVCHSMGGLVARWYIEKCGGAEVTRKLITLGTPYRGAVRRPWPSSSTAQIPASARSGSADQVRPQHAVPLPVDAGVCLPPSRRRPSEDHQRHAPRA